MKLSVDTELLEKSMNRSGLVIKEIPITGKNGQIFMRKQWVRPDELESKQSKAKTLGSNSAPIPKEQNTELLDPIAPKSDFDLGGFIDNIQQKKQEYLQLKEQGKNIQKVSKELLKLQKEADKLGLPDSVVSLDGTPDKEKVLSSYNKTTEKTDKKIVSNKTKKVKETTIKTAVKNVAKNHYQSVTSDSTNYYKYDEHNNREADMEDRSVYSLLSNSDQKIFDSIVDMASVPTRDLRKIFSKDYYGNNEWDNATSLDDVPLDEFEKVVKTRLVEDYLQMLSEKNSGIHSDIPKEYEEELTKTFKKYVKGSDKITVEVDNTTKENKEQTKFKDKLTMEAFKANYGKYTGDDVSASASFKAYMKDLKKERTTDSILKEFESMGITWKKSENRGINWMRASIKAKELLNSTSETKTTLSNSSEGNKQKVKELRDKHGKEALIKNAIEAGITWKKSDNDGINWMRVSSAIRNHLDSGGTFMDSSGVIAKVDKPTSETEKIVNTGNPIKDRVTNLKSKYGKESLMKEGYNRGMRWNESSNEGINWMRFSMELSKRIKSNSDVFTDTFEEKRTEEAVKPELKVKSNNNNSSLATPLLTKVKGLSIESTIKHLLQSDTETEMLSTLKTAINSIKTDLKNGVDSGVTPSDLKDALKYLDSKGITEAKLYTQYKKTIDNLSDFISYHKKKNETHRTLGKIVTIDGEKYRVNWRTPSGDYELISSGTESKKTISEQKLFELLNIKTKKSSESISNEYSESYKSHSLAPKTITNLSISEQKAVLDEFIKNPLARKTMSTEEKEFLDWSWSKKDKVTASSSKENSKQVKKDKPIDSKVPSSSILKQISTLVPDVSESDIKSVFKNTNLKQVLDKELDSGKPLELAFKDSLASVLSKDKQDTKSKNESKKTLKKSTKLIIKL